MNTKIEKYARVLSIMELDGLLSDKEMKTLVKHCIRTASETTAYHFTAHYRSKQVKELTIGIKSKSAYHKFCSNNFCHEHMVPCQVVYEEILSLENKDQKSISQLMDKFSTRATITRDEDELLTSLKLKSKMPAEFYALTDGYEDLYKNPYARYIVSGIYENLEVNDHNKLLN